ncbi:hypothetical protein D3C80_2179220 [compost metagenome]
MFEDSELLELAGLNAPQIMELSRKLNMSPLSYTVDDFAYRWNAVLPEHKKHRDQENGIESGQEVIENGICS